MSKQKVLIVDDSEMNRALLTDILEGSYDVAEAEDGAQAIEVLSQNDEDYWLVLLDIIMPGIDGFGVLESIREHQWSNRVVVMMISSGMATLPMSCRADAMTISWMSSSVNWY